MSEPRTLDVSGLPESGMGPRSSAWWGTVGFMLAEATSLVLCAATYLYLARHYDEWPPAGLAAPDLLIPTLSAVWLVACLLPAWLLGRAGKRKDAVAVKWLLFVSVAVELVAVALRFAELPALNVRWDANSYGSIVWWTIGLHTTLLLADLAETAVFAAIFLAGRQEAKHYGDATDVAMYWRFVALAWVPLYLLLYLSPRVL